VTSATIGNGQVFRLEVPPPAISGRMVLRLQGYRDVAAVRPKIAEIAERMAQQASTLAAPEVVVWRGPLEEVGTNSVGVAGQTFNSPTLARLLADASEIQAVLLSVGSGIEDQSHEMLTEGKSVEALFMDTCGWAAISLSVRVIRRLLEEQAEARSMRLTTRLAPGYRDWPLEEQAAIFELFGDAPLPASLNESAAMTPKKSLTAVFGCRGILS
jgi:hypothetical protein